MARNAGGQRPEAAAHGSPWKWTAGAITAGVLAALLATFPLVLHLKDSIPDCLNAPGACRDAFLCVWIAGEAGRRLYTDPLHLFEANIFHPLRHTLAYSESMLTAAAVVHPLHRLTANPVLAYNLYYLATYVLSALGVFLLVRRITGDPRGALVAAWLCALADGRWSYQARLPSISVHVVPFVLWAWIRFLDAPTWGRGLVLAGLWMAHLHVGAYQGLILPALVVPWAIVLVLMGPWPLRRWLASGGISAAAVLLGATLYLPYVFVHREVSFTPKPIGSIVGIERLWAGVSSLPDELRHPFSGPRRSPYASPLPLLALLTALAIGAVKRRPQDTTADTATGMDAKRLGPAPAGAPAPRGERAHLIAMIAFSLAAALVAADRPYLGLPRPFEILGHLPGYGSMRSPVRFFLLAETGAAVVMGIAVTSVLRRIRRRRIAAVLLVGIALLIVLDTRQLRQAAHVRPLGALADITPVYRWLATTPPDTAVLELPDTIDDALGYMLASLGHGRRLANGYSAIVPDLYRFGDDFPTADDIALLQDAGIRYLIVHTDRLRARRRPPLLLARLGQLAVLPHRWIGEALVVEVPESPPDGTSVVTTPDGSRAGDVLPIRSLEASDPGAAAAADGDIATHWTPAPGRRASWLRIDLGEPQRVAAIDLALGPHILEFPRAYEIRASTDGRTWTRVGGDPRTAPPLAAYRQDHLHSTLRLSLSPRQTGIVARYLEIGVPAAAIPRQLPLMRPLPNWGVHEVLVYGFPAA